MIEEWFLKPLQDLALDGPRRVAIDVGANRGEWSRWLALYFDQVFAVEPDPSALADFRKCGVPVNCALLPVACGRERGVMPYYVRQDSLQSSLQPVHPIGGHAQAEVTIKETLPTTVVTLDYLAGLFEHTAVDFLKIDVEGSEGDVLAGIQGSAFRRARVIIEIHDRQKEVGDELMRLGYDKISVCHHPCEEAHKGHFWVFLPPIDKA